MSSFVPKSVCQYGGPEFQPATQPASPPASQPATPRTSVKERVFDPEIHNVFVEMIHEPFLVPKSVRKYREPEFRGAGIQEAKNIDAVVGCLRRVHQVDVAQCGAPENEL